jgi:hypothetical protein
MKFSFIRNISEDIYSPTAIFAVDSEVRRLVSEGRVQVRWLRQETEAVAFMRRVLEVASIMARSEDSLDSAADMIADWDKCRRLAEAANNKLSQLLQHLARGTPHDPRCVDANGKAIPPQPMYLSTPLRHMRVRAYSRAGQHFDVKKVGDVASVDAGTLLNAAELLSWIVDESSANRQAIAKTAQNPGKPEKRAFAKYMMQGWIYLTGSRPSEKNRAFMDLLTLAWSDICDEEADWVQPARWAKKQISAQEVVELSTRGPHWV